MKREFLIRAKHHIKTMWYWYIVIAVAAVALTSFAVLLNKKETPHEQRIDIMMVTPTCADYALPYIADQILHSDGFETQKEVTFYFRDVVTNDAGVLIGSWMYTSEGDLFILNRNYAQLSAERGAMRPLDELITSNAIFDDLETDTCLSVNGVVYGIPLSYFRGFENLRLNTAGIYVGLTSYSQNQEMANRALLWLAGHMKSPIDQSTFDENVTNFLGGLYR